MRKLLHDSFTTCLHADGTTLRDSLFPCRLTIILFLSPAVLGAELKYVEDEPEYKNCTNNGDCDHLVGLGIC